MDEKKNSGRSIYDTNCVATLVTNRIPFHASPHLDSAGRVVFPFPDTPEVDRQIMDFYNRKTMVVALDYAENLRMVKGLISSVKRDKEVR